VILSEFCANAGYNRKYAIRLTEWTAAGKVEERTATWARSELQPRNGRRSICRALIRKSCFSISGGMGGSRLPLVDAAESAAAIVDAPRRRSDVDRSAGRLNRDI